MPDYQNIMTQYSSIFPDEFIKMSIKIPLVKFIFYRKYFDKNYSQYGINSIYYNIKSQGLSRLDNNFMKIIKNRHSQIVHLCKQYNTKVLYVPEVVMDKIYSEKLDILNKDLKNSFINYDFLEWFEVKNILLNKSNIFLDKMHFSHAGNEFFSSLLSEKIIKTYLTDN